MSGAHITINQSAGAGSGTLDAARVDLYQNRALSLVGDNSAGQTSPQWTILSWPYGSARTQPTSATAFTAAYTPDVPGSYLIEFLVGDGIGPNAIRRIFAVTKDTNGLIIDASIREPAFGERLGDDNSSSNDRGWARALELGMAAQVPTVATMATLITCLPDRHKRVFLHARASEGDGGGGHFRWDAASTTAHNAGTVVQPGYNTAAAVSTGRWVREYSGAIDDRWFGAVSDTAVDSAPAINAAIEAAWKNPTYDGVANTAGLAVTISGRRRCASEIHLEGGVTLQGLAGAYYYGASTLVFDAGVGDISDTDNGGCLIIDDDTSGPNSKSARGCVVRDLQLVQSHVGYDPLVRCTGIKIKTNCHLENLHITAFSCDGIDFGGANTNTWSMGGTIRIDRCDRHGLNVHGGETNAGNMAALLDITLCGSIGLYAGGFLGNNYSGAIHTAGNGYSLYNSGANWLFRDVDATAKVWSSAKAVTAGDIILPPVGDRNGWVYMAKTTGNLATGGGFPAWSTTEGTTFTSGTVTVEVWQREGTSIYSPSGSPLQNQFSWIYAETDQNPAQLFAGDVLHAAIQDFELDRGAAVRRGTTRGRDLPSPVYTRGDIDGTEWGFFLGVQMGGGFSEPLVAYRYSAGEQADGAYAGFYQDLGVMYMGRWRPDIKRWASDWSGGSWQGYTQCGGRSLPGPGAMCFNSLWLGPDHLERRLSALPSTSGFLPDFTGTVSHSRGAFQEGDIIINTCGTLDTPTQRYPVMWRPKRFGGGVSHGWSTATWAAAYPIYPGQVIVDSGYSYRAIQTTIGVTGGSSPTFPTSGPATVVDNTVTWEFLGPDGGAFEPVITQAPTMFSKDVTAGGAIVLSEDDSAHERIKFTGSPGGALSVEVKAGAGTGWVRTFWNASGQTVTVKGSGGDTGVAVADGATLMILSDGTNCRASAGTTGPAGPTGPTGPSGGTGPTGPTGPAGAAPFLQEENVTTNKTCGFGAFNIVLTETWTQMLMVTSGEVDLTLKTSGAPTGARLELCNDGTGLVNVKADDGSTAIGSVPPKVGLTPGYAIFVKRNATEWREFGVGLTPA